MFECFFKGRVVEGVVGRVDGVVDIVELVVDGLYRVRDVVLVEGVY